MKPVNFQLGKDPQKYGEYISLYLTDGGIELSGHEFDDYDSAASVFGVSHEMFEKIMSHYRFYWQMRDAQDPQSSTPTTKKGGNE